MNEKISLPIIYALSFALISVFFISIFTIISGIEFSNFAENTTAIIAGAIGATVKALHIL